MRMKGAKESLAFSPYQISRVYYVLLIDLKMTCDRASILQEEQGDMTIITYSKETAHLRVIPLLRAIRSPVQPSEL